MVKGKWKRRIYFAGGSFLSLLNALLPKDQKRICFFCKSGIEDNSEAFLSYLLETGYTKDYRIVCIVGDVSEYSYLKEKNVEVIPVKKCLWPLFRSKYLFCHGEMLAIMPAKGQMSVNFWHGMPLKKINRMVEKLGSYKYDFFTYVLSTSEMFREIFAESFGCRPDQVLINGYPRGDYFFQKKGGFLALNITKQDYAKIILWMPTYRRSKDGFIVDTTQKAKGGGFPLFHQFQDFKKLQDFLKEKNMLLVIKIHPAQDVTQMNMERAQLKNIRFLTSKELREEQVPLYTLLREADVLLTDYSSVYYDYLLLDRPEGFIIEDMDSYRDARGFVFSDPLAYMPGAKIRSLSELYQFLEECRNGVDAYSEKRARLNAQVNGWQNGRNCAQLCEKIGLHRTTKEEA